jgi:hypothetical protein
MYLSDLVQSSEDRQRLDADLRQHANYLCECVKVLIEAHKAADIAGGKDGGPHHISVLMLSRHVIEMIDGVAVLVSQGCIPVCELPLRCALEAFLGVLFILEKDNKNRGLAYIVGHVHRRIKFYQRCDANHPAGQELRKAIQDDLFGVSTWDQPPLEDYPKRIAAFEAMLRKPDYHPIEQAWQAARKPSGKPGQSKRKKGDPEWYALFSGPKSVKDLAYHLKFGGAYEALYRQWSDRIHAGSVFDSVGGSARAGASLRPLRHLEGVTSVSHLGGFFALMLAHRLIEVYDCTHLSRLQIRYEETQRTRAELRETKAPWK